jgi:uncharacterized protein (DUF1697 family)
MSEHSVVFYRTMNLGQPRSPDRAGLEAVLREAGGHDVRSFQTNGTVLFRADDPSAVVRRAAPPLADRWGYSDAGLVRRVGLLADILRTDPFQGFRDERTYRETLTFYEGGHPLPVTLPWTDARDVVDLVAARDGVALGIIRLRGSAAGSPTAQIERMTGGVATTRTLGTIRRLLRAAGVDVPA